jgi:hypothetical protein
MKKGYYIMAKDRTNFNMQLTTTQKEIMDFATEVIYVDYGFSKADTVIELFRKCALDYLGMNFENRIDDETLLYLLKDQKRFEDMGIIRAVGIEKYQALIDESKLKNPNLDYSYMESLLEDFKNGKTEKSYDLVAKED